jgi:hopanoid-associated phosphorylase
VLGILCGLHDEAKIAKTIAGAKVACAAAVPQKARALAEDLVKQGATSLMSFGVAGALDSSLPVGALVVGTHVLSKDGRWSCDAALGNVLAKQLPQALRGDVWGSETLVPTGAEKIGLNKMSGCIIVDMESQCAAEVAAKANLPLAVVRVVCDTANHNVPPLVMAAINPDGSTNYKNVLRGILREPFQLIDLIKVGRSMALAMKVLAQAGSQISV